MTMMKRLFTILLLISPVVMVHAGGIYQEPDAFIKEVFADDAAEVKVIWPDADLQKKMTSILVHKYKGLRIRYWIHGERTAWILDEIGKEKPITTGIVINNDKIERVRILAFRESRGWEVKHAFFTKQFENNQLSENQKLDRSINNISGATLSVRAVTKLAQLALLLHQQVTNNGTP